MASKYGTYVHGLDLSVNMVTTALERAFAAKDGHKVQLICSPLLMDGRANCRHDHDISDVRLWRSYDPACM